MKRALITMLCMCIAGATIVQAQNQPPRSMNGNVNDRTNNIRAMITWRLIEYLDMDEDQSAEILPEWNKFNRERGRIYHQRGELSQSILAEVEKPTVEDKELLEDVQKLKENRDEEYTMTLKFYERARKVLGDRQYAKLMVFEEKLKEDLFNQFGGPRR